MSPLLFALPALAFVLVFGAEGVFPRWCSLLLLLWLLACCGVAGMRVLSLADPSAGGPVVDVTSMWSWSSFFAWCCASSFSASSSAAVVSGALWL